MGYLTATEYTLQEYVGDNLVSIIDRKEADGTFKSFVHLSDKDDESVLISSNEMNAIALKIVELEQQMKKNSPLREKKDLSILTGVS